MVRPLRMKLGQVAICKWGPLLKDETSDDVPMQHRLMTAALRQIYAGQRGMMLSIMPRAEPAPDNSAWSNLQTLGFRPGAELRYPARYLVNVRLDGDAAIRSLEQKWWYNLRQSFRHGLRFEAGEPQQLGEFDALYKAMSDRKRFADHSAYGSFDRFMEEIVPEARPRLFFVRKDGELVAGAVVFTCGRTAVYLCTAPPTPPPCRCVRDTSCTGTSSPGCARTRRRSGTTWAAPMVSTGCTSSRRGWWGTADLCHPCRR
jgi:hypothetical protein